MYKKIFIKLAVRSIAFLSFFTALTLLDSCKGKEAESVESTEDLAAKKSAQGVWVDENEGDIVFRILGDTLYYPDGIGEPASFRIENDTLFINTSSPTTYKIKQLTANALRLINADGDELDLLRSNAKADLAHFTKDQHKESQINQGQLIKRDSVMTLGDKRYHAYVQVNPTKFKVLKQNITADGMTIDNAYYDNIIHISVYDGARKVYSHDIHKTDFSKHVPAGYLEHSILSDILIRDITSEGVNFEAIIAEPESYTSYNIKITITDEGKVKFAPL